MGFSVVELAPFRAGRAGMRMGLVPLAEGEWRRQEFDQAVRVAAFEVPGTLVMLPGADAAGRELAALIGVAGGLREAACAGWEDLCLLERRGNAHVLIGGALGFATDWRLGDKVGLPLLDVHAPIHGYADKLARGVEHFLRELRVGQLFGRANWFVVESDAMCYLPEDDPSARFAHVSADNAGETLFVRCERQTFRRLPETGAIVFGIGVYVARLDTLSADLVRDLATAVLALPKGEDERRAAPYYTPALCGYAARVMIEEAA